MIKNARDEGPVDLEVIERMNQIEKELGCVHYCNRK